ncbi:hypothetical protein, partial [Synechococcus sp. CB0205]|uniref:hypothetical protein n=1 Tax=Synechococcus sp. CB0205 TaxID=232363 RepID=UPI0002001E42
SFLAGVTGASTVPSELKLDKALVAVQSRSGASTDAQTRTAELSAESLSLLDPEVYRYSTVTAGSVSLSGSEWSRFSAKPNWRTSDLGYTHYYYLHDASDRFSLSENERAIWSSVFRLFDEASERFLPLRFLPVASAQDATLVIYNAPDRSDNTLGATSRPISGDGVVSGFWQTISTYRDEITGFAAGDSTQYARLFRFVALHELAHSLGLDHPFDNTLWPGVRETDNPSTTGPLPSETVMTYNFNLQTISHQFSPADREALQSIWGTPSVPNMGFTQTFEAVARQSIQDLSFNVSTAALPFVI